MEKSYASHSVIKNDNHIIKRGFHGKKLLPESSTYSLFVPISSAGSVACVAYLGFHAYRPVVWSVIWDLVGSALVWAFVELIDFFVETHVQFIAEWTRFFIMVQEYWHQLRQLLRNKKNTTEIFLFDSNAETTTPALNSAAEMR